MEIIKKLAIFDKKSVSLNSGMCMLNKTTTNAVRHIAHYQHLTTVISAET